MSHQGEGYHHYHRYQQGQGTNAAYEDSDMCPEVGSDEDGPQEYAQGPRKDTPSKDSTTRYVDERQKTIGGPNHSQRSKNKSKRKANRKIEEFERKYKKSDKA